MNFLFSAKNARKLLRSRSTIIAPARNTTTYLPRPGDGKIKAVTLIPGEGIGPQLVESVATILDVLKAPVKIDLLPHFSHSDPQSIEKLKKHKIILKGPVSQKQYSSYSDNIAFTRALDLFAYVVHAFSIPGVETRYKDVDIVIIRESSEGDYTSIEHEVLPGIIETIKVITREKSRRIAEYAFEYALLSNRKKVTVVHKANVSKVVDAQFLEVA